MEKKKKKKIILLKIRQALLKLFLASEGEL
jgi:hypothetical protein